MVVRRVRVHPGPLEGRLRLPGDKSLSHRALLLGALCGDADVAGLAPSGDVRSTALVLGLLGLDVQLSQDEGGMLAGHVRGRPTATATPLDCGNSGTAMRLLAGICAALDGTSTLVGDASLSTRPMERVATPLRAMGAEVATSIDGTAPLVIRGGRLHAVVHDCDVASAQVKSAILLAAAFAGVPARITSPLPSRDHTERMLQLLGCTVTTTIDPGGHELIEFEPGTMATSATFVVPGDPSSAAFWLVAGALGDGEVVAEGVSVNPRRTGIVEVLRLLGADIDIEAVAEALEPVGSIRVAGCELAGGASISGLTVVDAIDELPVLALAGALSVDGLEVRDAAELRTKESDRIAATARSLGALGITVLERGDGYFVPGGQRPAEGIVDAEGDHRIAMTAAIAATVGTGPVEITGFESVATSYPNFLTDLARLGGIHEVLDDH